MKNILRISVLSVFSVILFSSCKDDSIETVGLDDITLSQSALQLSVDEIQSITASTSPENATEKVTWSSSDESVAKIQSNAIGLVSGVKGMSLGTAVLTATSQSGKVLKTVNVEVIVKVASIALEEEEIADPSQTKYNVVFTPTDATYKTVEWTSSDTNVVTLVDGVVTATGVGTAVISATTTEGKKSASVEIVTSGDPPILGLQYCTATGTKDYNADSIKTTGADADIDHSAGQPTDNYGYYENEILIAQPGGSFDLSVVQSNNWSMTLVYIDWNGDKDFLDSGELAQQFGLQSQSNNGPFSTTVNVPLDAFVGTVRMRVLTGDAWTTDPAAAPCGEYANSTIKDFNIEIGGVAYCAVSGTKDYNTDSVTTTGGDTNINHADGQPTGNYGFYSDQALTVSAGGSFDLSVVQSNNWSMTVVWVDWNADGDFKDDKEQVNVFGLVNQLNNGPFSATVEVPADTMSGTVRMRVLTGDAWTTDPAIQPCDEYINSTIKDFIVNIN